MYCCALVVLPSSLVVISRSCSYFFFCANYTRAAGQNMTSPTSTQHSIAQGNQLCTSSFWHYQIDSYTKSWASSFCPLHICCILPCAIIASGPRQPPVERGPYRTILTTSAVSSTDLGSILIFASCVLNRSPVFSKFHKLKPNIRLYLLCYLSRTD